MPPNLEISLVDTIGALSYPTSNEHYMDSLDAKQRSSVFDYKSALAFLKENILPFSISIPQIDEEEQAVGTDEEEKEWVNFAAQNFLNAYSDDEPDYSDVELIKENPLFRSL